MRMSARSLSAFCVVALACLAHAAHGRDEFTFSRDDDFTGYQEGSDASPAWETGSIGWEVRRGAFTCDEPSKDFASLARSPLGREVRVSAEVTLRGTAASGWKVAGVCVRRDPRNYWHLALVEAPDKDGKRHFVELTEMLDGRWLAQFQERTKLRRTSAEGEGFDWRYGRAYRLEVALSPSGIEGTVAESDGTRRVRIAYAFDQAAAARAVTHGMPGLVSGGFKSEFRRFSSRAGDEVAEERRRDVRPPYASRGFPEIRGEATGFFHVEERDGTWWMIDPHGNSFFGIGTDHVNYNVHWCEKLGYAPYHRSCERKYGSAGKWADSAVPRLLSWGFNCVGVNSSPEVRYRGLAHMTNLSMGTRFAERDPITPKTTWTGFPNVFSPKFRPFCEKMAKRVCEPQKDDPWLVGYFIDNELEWHAWTGGGPFVDTFEKPADHSAKRALVDFFKGRYAGPAGFASFASFNEAWGTKVASLDDLLGMTKAPAAKTDAAKADVRAFVRLAADRYFAVTSAAIRKHDPNHMIMGCRFAGGAPDILDVAGKHCDVFSINCYRKVDLERGVMTDGFEEQLREWFARVKRPFIVTEWSFPALDAGLPCKHGAGQRVPTQKDKAFAFTVFQKLLFSTPFVVGSNYFMWADEPELGISSTFPEDSNYGLVNVDDEPYELLTQAATRLHPVVCHIHGGRVTDFWVRPGGERGSFTGGNRGTAGGRCKRTIWIDGKPRESESILPPGAGWEVVPPASAIERPGAHFFVCTIEPREPLLDRSPEGKLATRTFYVPGSPWYPHAKGRTRTPILVANPTGVEMWSVRVSMKLSEALQGQDVDPAGLFAIDAETGAGLHSQVEALEGGAKLALALADPLGPRSARTVFLYHSHAGLRAGSGRAPAFREVGEGFEIDSGAFLLVKTSREDGNAFERVVLRDRPGGVELGRFTPLVWQGGGQNLWVAPDRVEDVEVSRGTVRLVLDVTASRGGPGRDTGEMKTAVDDEGKYAAAARGPRAFRVKYRFVIYPGRNWFESRLVWIENTDDVPWKLEGYYHYAVSSIAGDAADDVARGDRWVDEAAGACYGVVPGSPEIKVTFWKDKGGGEHPDAFRKLGITLAPGERYDKVEPVAHVVGCRESKWNEVAREIGRHRKVVVRAFAPEGR